MIIATARSVLIMPSVHEAQTDGQYENHRAYFDNRSIREIVSSRGKSDASVQTDSSNKEFQTDN